MPSTRKGVQGIEQYPATTIAQSLNNSIVAQCNQLKHRINQGQAIVDSFFYEIDALIEEVSSAQTLEDIKTNAGRYTNATSIASNNLDDFIQTIQRIEISNPQLNNLQSYYSKILQATSMNLENAGSNMQLIADVESIEELRSIYPVFSESLSPIGVDFSALEVSEAQALASINEICLANSPEDVDISDFIASFPNSRGFITANRLLGTDTSQNTGLIDGAAMSGSVEQQPEPDQNESIIGQAEGRDDFQRVQMGAQEVFLFEIFDENRGEVIKQKIHFGTIYSSVLSDVLYPRVIVADYNYNGGPITDRPSVQPDVVKHYANFFSSDGTCPDTATVRLEWNQAGWHNRYYESWTVRCTVPPEEAIANILSLTYGSPTLDCEQFGADNNDIYSSQYWVRQACLAFEAENLDQGALALTIAYQEAVKEDQLQVNHNSFAAASNKINNELPIAQAEPEQSHVEQVSRQAASLLVGFIPGVGTATDWVNAITGVDQITGEELEWWESVLSLVPYGRRVGQLTQAAINKIDDVASGVGRRLDEFARDESGSITIGRGGWTNAAARKRAQELGFEQVEPGSLPRLLQNGTQGAPVFQGRLPETNQRVYISPDIAGHGRARDPEPLWKVFNQRGERIGTYTNDLQERRRN
ncbi:pre-toxin TG domain-containing protein [Adonisia turfae]|uniref:pre-toxin TG domain-containing protein n=1 Tax=Adonisia turfae TaxID=2950184 RepID=UPI0032B4ED6C